MISQSARRLMRSSLAASSMVRIRITTPLSHQ